MQRPDGLDVATFAPKILRGRSCIYAWILSRPLLIVDEYGPSWRSSRLNAEQLVKILEAYRASSGSPP